VVKREGEKSTHGDEGKRFLGFFFFSNYFFFAVIFSFVLLFFLCVFNVNF